MLTTMMANSTTGTIGVTFVAMISLGLLGCERDVASPDEDEVVIDVLPIPKGLYYRVRKAKHQQILNGLFPQIMIYSINLFLIVMAMQLSVQFACAG